MSKKGSDFDFIQKISLSSRISFRHPNLKHYVGSNTELSKKIAKITVLMEYGLIPETPETLLALDLLKEERWADFLWPSHVGA